MHRIASLAAILSALVSACGVLPASDGGNNENDGHHVRISELVSQSRLSVTQGEVVVFENDLATDHSITSLIGLWDSGRIRPGESFSHQFNAPGEYAFLSVFRPEIQGSLNVDPK